MVPLRPLSLGDILDGAFTTIRRHWAVVFGMSAVAAAVAAGAGLVASLATTPTDFSPASTSTWADLRVGDAVALLVGVVVPWVARTALTGAVTVVVGQAVLGRGIRAGEAWAAVRPRVWALLGVSLLTSLLQGVGLVLCIVPGVVLWVFWLVSPPPVVLERVGVVAAMRRSWRLVRGSGWRVLGIGLLAALITSVVAGILSVPFSAGAVLTSLASLDTSTPVVAGAGSAAAALLTAVGTLVSGTVAWPFFAAVVALLYIDLRMRRERLDLELARAAGVGPGTGPEDPAPSAGRPPAT